MENHPEVLKNVLCLRWRSLYLMEDLIELDSAGVLLLLLALRVNSFIQTIYSLLRSVLGWPLAVPCFEAALTKSSVFLLEAEYLDKTALVINIPVHMEHAY